MHRAAPLLVLLALAACSTAQADPPPPVRTVSVPSPAYAAADGAAGIQIGVWVDGLHQAQLAQWYEAAAKPRFEPSKASKNLGGNRPTVAYKGSRSGTYNSIEACIVARENGGDYGRSSNPSHFGAYQFSRSTWAANGGNPNTWGSASPAEQDAVFRNTVAAHGYSAWTPYDHCG